MRKKTQKIPTPESLANIALFYLSRFAASEASLRRVLMNRIQRATMSHPDFAADHAAQQKLHNQIDIIVEKHKKIGALNDDAFAKMKTTSLRRSGQSARAISHRLSQKGVAAEKIDEALKTIDAETGEDAEMKAALTFARKKRLGPYAAPNAAQKKTAHEQKRKDFAAFARAGFSYDISRRILGGEIEEYVLTDY